MSTIHARVPVSPDSDSVREVQEKPKLVKGELSIDSYPKLGGAL
jgi:hypothetical protein